MRKTCLNMVYELAKSDPRVVFIGSDLGSGTLDNFKKEMPERFFMEGISEANIVGVASGLAMEGKIPYVNTIASFITRRAFEQVLLDVCLHNLNVRLIGNGGGLVYAPLGPTHMTIEDIAIMRSIPNMTIVAPADENEMKQFMLKTVDYSGPIYIRLAKGYDPIVTKYDQPFEIAKAVVMTEGKDAVVFSTGITLKIALECAENLLKQGIELSIIHLPTIKPLDDSIINLIEKVPLIVTIEEHSIIGGIGSCLGEIIAESNLSGSKIFKRIGITDSFPDEYGSQSSLMEKYSITNKNLESIILNNIKRKS